MIIINKKTRIDVPLYLEIKSIFKVRTIHASIQVEIKSVKISLMIRVDDLAFGFAGKLLYEKAKR